MRQIGQADLEMLELAAAAGEICLKYLDESGFSLWSNPSYTWYQRGQQKSIEQTKRRGRRLSICGFLELGKSFNYGLSIKGFRSNSYIKLIDWEAQAAQQRLLQTGKITVIVQDQAPMHKSQAVKTKISDWEESGLYIFQLPKYCSQMNRIESEWLRIKEDEIAGQMFEDEYDLAMAVMASVENRARQKELRVERFRFQKDPSTS